VYLMGIPHLRKEGYNYTSLKYDQR